MQTLVLDNGAHTIKLGYSNDDEATIFPNCIVKAKSVRNRVFIGNEIETDCKDLSSLFLMLPFQRGYMVNGEIQKRIWDNMFTNSVKVDFANTNIILTEAYENYRSLQEQIIEVFFEEYGFNSIFKCNPSFLSQFLQQTIDPRECCVIVDTGYSYTHIVPYHGGLPQRAGMRRIDVGGKIMTNHLKDIISYRYINVMDETYVMNQMKEDVCYVSQDFLKDVKTSKKHIPDNPIVCDYVLPDYTHCRRGYKRESKLGKVIDKNEQFIRMNIERFALPEVLFNPSDVGIEQMGIAEAVVDGISNLSDALQPHLYDNIILTGGNANFPGFRDRLYKELRTLAPAEFPLSVTTADSPTTMAWQGGCKLVNASLYESLCISKEDFDEYGHSICVSKFNV